MAIAFFLYSLILLPTICFSLLLGLRPTHQLAKPNQCTFRYNYWIIAGIPIVIYTAIIGSRYDIGVDFMQYWTILDELQNGRIYRENIDPLYLVINQCLAALGLGPWSIFYLTSFLFIFAFYFLLKKYREVAFFAAPLFLVNTFIAENLVRQCFSISLLMLGISFYLNGTIFIFVVLSIAAFFIHSSSIIAIPALVVLKNNFRLPLLLILTVYFACWAIGPKIFPYLSPIIEQFYKAGIMTDYTAHIEALVDDSRMDLFSSASDAGRLFRFATQIFAIVYGHKIYFKYRERNFSFFYNAFLLSACLKPIVERHELFNRFEHVFGFLSPVAYGFIAYDIITDRQPNHDFRWLSYIPLVAIFAFYIYSFYCGVSADATTMGHPFMFYWER